MNENSDLLPNLLHEDFEMQMRGYSRRQVDEFVARRNAEIRELEQRLARALDESEQLRGELSIARQQALAGRPAHEEVSERIAQILKLADDEAKAQRNKADDDIARLRTDAQHESERVRADAREQADHMLTAAQEQAERTIAAARAEADKTRTTARSEVDRLTSETRKKSDAAVANAKAQAKKLLDEATARATAIHDGAERRLNLLSTRHTETVRRLEDILDGVQGLVAAEAARMSLEEEVAQSVSKAIGAADAADSAEAPEPDLARLAPPAPETIANGSVAAPPGTGGDLLPPPPVRSPIRPRAMSRPGLGAATEDSALDRPRSAPDTDFTGSGSAIGSAGPGRGPAGAERGSAGPGRGSTSPGRLPMGRPAGIGGISGISDGGVGGSGSGSGTEPAFPMPPAPPISPMPPISSMPGRSARLDGPVSARLDGPTPEGAPRSTLPIPSSSSRLGPAMPGSPQQGLGSPQPGLSQPGLSQPGLSQPGPGQPGAGHADGMRHSDSPEPGNGPQQERDTKRDGSHANIIDPDDPTEGIRLMK